MKYWRQSGIRQSLHLGTPAWPPRRGSVFTDGLMSGCDGTQRGTPSFIKLPTNRRAKCSKHLQRPSKTETVIFCFLNLQLSKVPVPWRPHTPLLVPLFLVTIIRAFAAACRQHLKFDEMGSKRKGTVASFYWRPFLPTTWQCQQRRLRLGLGNSGQRNKAG